MNDMVNVLRSLERREDVHYLFNQLGLKVLCEVGVRHGENIVFNWLPSRPQLVFAVDIWKDTTYQWIWRTFQSGMWKGKCLPVLAENRDCVRLMRMKSVEAASVFDDGYFDFVYIDADHGYQSVREDIEAWWPKVKKYGILAGDDYVSYRKYGVIRAVDEFVQTNQLQDMFHVTPRGHLSRRKVEYYDQFKSWFVVKP